MGSTVSITNVCYPNNTIPRLILNTSFGTGGMSLCQNKNSFHLSVCVFSYVWMVCVCVCERERAIEREAGSHKIHNSLCPAFELSLKP